MRIALFTPFSPDLGGGSVQLKSLLPELKEFEITWYYLGQRAAHSWPGKWLGEPIMGGPIAGDVARSARLWTTGGSERIREIVRSLDADAVWVVAMNEGVLVGLEAGRLGLPLHVTVHDDPARMFAHSTRYRLFAPMMKRAFERLLRAAKSVDTISDGMSSLYRARHGIKCLTVFRYVQSLPSLTATTQENGSLRAGHIGSIYTTGEFRRFMHGLRAYSEQTGLKAHFVKIGTSRNIDIVEREFPGMVEDLGELDEPLAIQRLATCHFVYCMYPGDDRYRVFRETSQPMKLTTYVQAQRPIFAHTPAGSTLERVVRTYELGTTCAGRNANEMISAIDSVRRQLVPLAAFEKVRAEMLGSVQVRALAAALNAL